MLEAVSPHVGTSLPMLGTFLLRLLVPSCFPLLQRHVQPWLHGIALPLSPVLFSACSMQFAPFVEACTLLLQVLLVFVLSFFRSIHSSRPVLPNKALVLPLVFSHLSRTSFSMSKSFHSSPTILLL